MTTPILSWNGQTLSGDDHHTTVIVEMLARMAAFASFTLPPGDPAALRAATALRARRCFMALHPAAIEAIIGTVEDGQVPVLALAVPQAQIQALSAVATARSLRLRQVRIAELARPVGADGLVTISDATCRLKFSPAGNLVAVEVSGSGPATTVDGPRHPAPGLDIDLNRPRLSHGPTLWRRPGLRLVGLALALLLILAGLFVIHLHDQVVEAANMAERAGRLRPQAEDLRQRRENLRDLAPWFEARPSIMPALTALAQVLDDAPGPARIHLTRLRQHDARHHGAEGVARGRESLMGYVAALRDLAEVRQVEIRQLTSGGDGSRLIFELVIDMMEAGHADP